MAWRMHVVQVLTFREYEHVLYDDGLQKNVIIKTTLKGKVAYVELHMFIRVYSIKTIVSGVRSCRSGT